MRHSASTRRRISTPLGARKDRATPELEGDENTNAKQTIAELKRHATAHWRRPAEWQAERRTQSALLKHTRRPASQASHKQHANKAAPLVRRKAFHKRPPPAQTCTAFPILLLYLSTTVTPMDTQKETDLTPRARPGAARTIGALRTPSLPCFS